jgi:hypothetical protein
VRVAVDGVGADGHAGGRGVVVDDVALD